MRALLESEHTYHLVFARERDAMSLVDSETKRLLDVNDAWCALYGYSREEAERASRSSDTWDENRWGRGMSRVARAYSRTCSD